MSEMISSSEFGLHTNVFCFRRGDVRTIPIRIKRLLKCRNVLRIAVAYAKVSARRVVFGASN